MLKKLKTLFTVLVTVSLILALICITKAQALDEMQAFFSKDYAGISIQVNATREAVPSSDLAINLWINCTADGVYADYLNLSVYGYRHFRYGLEKITLNATCVMQEILLAYNYTSEYNYTAHIPNDVWDLTYAELDLEYTIKGSPFQYNEIFPITTVRNVLWMELEEQLKSLNASYQQLNLTLEQLNRTFWESFKMNFSAENLALLNQTYWQLRKNYTALQISLGDLDNARRAMAILAVTTIFFVATTIFFVMRKPKKYW